MCVVWGEGMCIVCGCGGRGCVLCVGVGGGDVYCVWVWGEGMCIVCGVGGGDGNVPCANHVTHSSMWAPPGWPR